MVEIAGKNTKQEIESWTKNATDRILNAMERRFINTWNQQTDFQNWTIYDSVLLSNNRIEFSSKIMEDLNEHGTNSNDWVTAHSTRYNFSDHDSISWLFEAKNNGNNMQVRLLDESNNNVLKDLNINSSSYQQYNESVDVSSINEEIKISCQFQDGASLNTVNIRNIEITDTPKWAKAITPVQSSVDVSMWERLYFDQVLDNESISVDIVDNNDNILKNNVSDGDSIEDISQDKDIKVIVELSRTNTANNPHLNSLTLTHLA